MRRIFRRAVALTIVFALVASAAAWRQCTALQAVASIEHAAHHASAIDHGESDHHMVHHQHVGDVPASAPTEDDHGCMKCCSMCGVTTDLLPDANVIQLSAISGHVFSHREDIWSGNTITVDPGIPKPIA